ncbi:MAG TPA: SMC-Scp complex subunit ScpB [Thermomicrobiaceae bacterium]|nr:SMC-Scp complex subunit ScpB [Thermomicrobiaceae bacterium]
MPEPDQQLPLDAIAPEERVAALGALLFVAPEPVPLARLAQQLGCTPDETRAAASLLAERLAAVGLLLQWADQALQLASAPRFARLLQRFLGLERGVRLSQAALETLAIVAYIQPVTRLGIEAVRGVDSTGVLQTLLARGLVEPVGRLPAVGSPVLYGTSPDFLRFFGLTSLAELPPLPEELATLIERAEEHGG